MSEQRRAKPVSMTICDLCDKEIEQGAHPDERGSLTWGYIAREVGPKTKHAWFRWPPPDRVRRSDYYDRQADPEQFRPRRYDFHGECILRLVESAVVTKAAQP